MIYRIDVELAMLLHIIALVQRIATYFPLNSILVQNSDTAFELKLAAYNKRKRRWSPTGLRHYRRIAVARGLVAEFFETVLVVW